MSGVLVHDGRRPGHQDWAADVISRGGADGVIVSPFMTPRFRVPRYASGGDVVDVIGDVGGEIVFDSMTHARLLPGSNRLDLYDTWELWPGSPTLDTLLDRQRHVERVFARQDELGTPRLAPTLSLDTPLSADATLAQEMRVMAAGMDSAAWQSLAGTRLFWRSGAALDAYVGSLAELRSPVWVITVSNEIVLDPVPDLSDVEAFSGLLRTIHSLSARSRVIVAHADFSGLPSVAAGADTIGAGWDRGMRTFDPLSYHQASDAGIRIPASYVTQRGLASVLRRDAAEAIERWNSGEALRIRGAAMPGSERAERLHHLTSLRELVTRVNRPTHQERVDELRAVYAQANTDYATLISAIGPAVRGADQTAWVNRAEAVLENYATAEGL